MRIHDWQVTNADEVEKLYNWLMEQDTSVKIRVNKRKTYTFEDQISKLIWLTGLEAMLNLQLDGPSVPT